MNELADLLLKLRIKTRLCVNVSLKIKLLYLIKDRPLPPQDLISALNIHKSNLAIMCGSMCKDGLIEKKQRGDKRQINYMITEKGSNSLNDALKKIEEPCTKAFTKDEYKAAVESIEAAIKTLEFII